jgi:hypothetical protein
MPENFHGISAARRSRAYVAPVRGQHPRADAATRLHQDHYQTAETLYIAEVDPCARADLVVDNRDFASPRIVGNPPA